MAGCCQSCDECASQELLPENFLFGYHKPRVFIKSQWCKPTCAYTIYRVCVALLIPVWIAMDYWAETREFYWEHPEIWFIFATDWGFFILGLSAILHAGICVYYLCRTRNRPETPLNQSGKMSAGLMVFWCVYNIAANNAIVITLSYWTYLTAMDHAGFLATPLSRLKHTLNTVYVIVDLFINAVPIRIFHLIYPLLMGVLYTLFNLVYFDNGGVGPGGKPYTYYVMDWQYPVTAALTCATGLILSVLSQLLLYSLADLRGWIYRKLSGPEEEDDSEMESFFPTADTGSYESVCETDIHIPTSHETQNHSCNQH